MARRELDRFLELIRTAGPHYGFSQRETEVIVRRIIPPPTADELEMARVHLSETGQ